MILEFDPAEQEAFEKKILDKWRDTELVGGYFNDRNIALALEITKDLCLSNIKQEEMEEADNWVFSIIVRIFMKVIPNITIYDIEDHVVKIFHDSRQFFKAHDIKRMIRDLNGHVDVEAELAWNFVEKYKVKYPIFA